MKKSLIITLALIFVLGIAGTAFAAGSNPFSDVPAKHWAYDAVNKLVKAGVVDGYNDGTFRGDKTMTRFEMAQIVAKAMVKSDKADAETKALVDKLAKEFASELNVLGVRVTKLEKQMGTVQWSGDGRWRINDKHKGDSETQSRTRIAATANVNSDVKFTGKFMLQRHTVYGTTTKDENIVNESNFTFKNFYGTEMTLGRQSVKLGATGYFLSTWGLVDGVKAQFGNVAKVTAGYADFGPATRSTIVAAKSQANSIDEAYFANLDLKTSKASSVTGFYLQEVCGYTNDYTVYGLGFNSKLNKIWSITGDYVKNIAVANDPYGYVFRLNYKGAKASNPQSWGMTVEYDKWEKGTYVNWNDYCNAAALPTNGWKYIGVTTKYTLAKNIVGAWLQTYSRRNADTGKHENLLNKFQIDYTF